MVTSRTPFEGQRGLQVANVANPLGNQWAYNSQKSQALWGPRGSQIASPFVDQSACTCRKPFAGPTGLQVAKVASPLGTKGPTSRKSRKPFVGPGAYKLQKSQALWGTKGLTTRKGHKPLGPLPTFAAYFCDL